MPLEDHDQTSLDSQDWPNLLVQETVQKSKHPIEKLYRDNIYWINLSEYADGLQETYRFERFGRLCVCFTCFIIFMFS